MLKTRTRCVRVFVGLSDFFCLGLDGVFYSVFNFGTFCVVEVIKGTYKITGDAADSFKAFAVFFFSSAFRAFVADDSGESAFGVTVNRVVNRAVTYAGFFHAADYLFESVKVLLGVAVKFDIGDVACVGKSMVRCFSLDFIESADGIIYRNMEGVGVIIAVGNAGNLAEFFCVHANKSSGKTFCGSCKKGKVKAVFFAGFVHSLSHESDDLKTKVLCFLAFAVVETGKRFKTFRKADETDGKGSVFKNFADFVIFGKFFGIDPDSLTHKEGIVADFFLLLNFKSFKKLFDYKGNLAVELVEEKVDVVVGKNCKSRKVDGSEGKVSAAGNNFSFRIVNVSDNSGAAAHICNFGFRMSFFIILKVIGSIDEGEVREKAFCADFAGKFKEVIVGVAGVIVGPPLWYGCGRTAHCA